MNEMMRREIEAQGALLSKLQPQLAEAADQLPRGAGRILAGGCGDSAFAPQALQDVFRSIGLDVEAKTSMEIAAFTTLKATDTVLLSSISGSTKRTVDAAKAARAVGAETVAITCNGESELAAAASHTIVLPFTPLSRKTPHTLDYAVTLLALAEIARSFAGLDETALSCDAGDLQQRLAASDERARGLAATHKPSGKLVLLGAGCDLGTANYAAAKFHEAGGLLALSAETENFIHGMNFMLELDDTLIALASMPAAEPRARSVTEAFSGLCQTHLVTEIGGGLRPAAAFRRLLSQTFTMQLFCLAIADQQMLRLEQPRAGRTNADAHAEAQRQAMAFSAEPQLLEVLSS
jgi:fructoselysine-6-P-deglycase FrlB-like protein